MRTTIDAAGRLVIPKALREQVGLGPGEVEISTDGAGVRVEAVPGDALVEVDGKLIIPASGDKVTDDDVQALRHATQR